MQPGAADTCAAENGQVPRSCRDVRVACVQAVPLRQLAHCTHIGMCLLTCGGQVCAPVGCWRRRRQAAPPRRLDQLHPAGRWRARSSISNVSGRARSAIRDLPGPCLASAAPGQRHDAGQRLRSLWCTPAKALAAQRWRCGPHRRCCAQPGELRGRWDGRCAWPGAMLMLCCQRQGALEALWSVSLFPGTQGPAQAARAALWLRDHIAWASRACGGRGTP